MTKKEIQKIAFNQEIPEIEKSRTVRNPDGVCLEHEHIRVRGNTLAECENTLMRINNNKTGR